MPPGGGGSIQIDELNVSGSKATGTLAIVDGGFDGRLAIAGGGLSGELLFRPVGTIQRIEAHIDLTAAKLANNITLRRGRIDAVMLLDPAGTSIEATATGAGLRRGTLSLGRFAANVSLRGGRGQIRASIAGSRGRAFDIQTVTEVTPRQLFLVGAGHARPPSDQAGDAGGVHPRRRWLAAGAHEVELRGRRGAVRGPVHRRLDCDRRDSVAHAAVDPRYRLSRPRTRRHCLGQAFLRAGHGTAPTGRVDMTVRGLTRSGLILSSQPVDVGIAGILQPGKAAARAVAKSGGKTVGRAQAQLTLSGSGDLPTQFANAGLFAQLRYDGPADTLWRLTGMELFDLTGPVAIGADLGGKVNDPQIRGVVEAKNARIESGVTGTLLTNVQANGRFGGSRLVIDRFAADAGKGGRVTGTGTFDLAAANGFGIDLAIRADNAVMINRDDIGATVTGPLTIKSDGQGGVIGGDLLLNKSRYRLGQATTASAVPQLNIREINLPGGGEEEDIPRKPWRLAIKARAPGQLMVSGLGLTSEWSADLQIGGAPENPAITGQADLIRGDYEFAGRQFELERGRIRFAGEVPANPSLDIAANADSTGLSATIRVTGFAQKPEIGFSSTPALPEDELLSRLLFGTSITNLSAPEALQLAAAVAALRDGSGGLNPINAVRRAAGLDRLRILPADPQTGAGTSVAAGKYITRRLFAEIITDGQGYSATQVEFQVTRWLSILSSISTLGRQSANLRVSKDY